MWRLLVWLILLSFSFWYFRFLQISVVADARTDVRFHSSLHWSAEFSQVNFPLTLWFEIYSDTRNVGKCPTWWSPCRIWVVPSVQRRKVWLTPTTRCGAVMLSRRETSWNLQGCPKLVNRSQPLVGWSSPYCEDMWRRYCCVTFFSDCRYVPQLRRHSPTKLCDGAQMAIFGDFFASCIFSEPRAAHFRSAS